jgi:hypothetical protein
LLGKRDIFRGRNLSDEGFDLFHGTRAINKDIPYKKIDPLDYPGYAPTEEEIQAKNIEMFLRVTSIEGFESGSSTFLVCDDSKLKTGDHILIQNSGIVRTSTGSVIDFPVSGTVFQVLKDPSKRNGIYLRTLDRNLNVGSKPGELNKNAEIFVKLTNSKVLGASVRTNCVIKLKNPIPEDYPVGQDVYINKVFGMNEINQKKYRIRWISEDKKQLVLYDYRKSPSIPTNNLAVIDSSSYSEYDNLVENNGNCYLYFDTVEGLEHLEGLEVSICNNGNNSKPKTVYNGKIILDEKSMYCAVGLNLKSYFKTVPFSGGSVLGSSVGVVGSQKDIGVYLYYSLGGRYGAEARETYTVPYKYKRNILLDSTQNLFTGLIKLPMPNALDIYSRTIYFEHSEPLAFNILSIAHDINVSDA